MLGVTSITDCRYCQWGHTHWAMAHGVPLEEVNQILGQQIESLEAKNPAEAAAILFAQHYAENLDRFDPESIENLRKHYSDAQVAEILAYVRAITLGSLTGNTVDAFLGRTQWDCFGGGHSAKCQKFRQSNSTSCARTGRHNRSSSMCAPAPSGGQVTSPARSTCRSTNSTRASLSLQPGPNAPRHRDLPRGASQRSRGAPPAAAWIRPRPPTARRHARVAAVLPCCRGRWQFGFTSDVKIRAEAFMECWKAA